MGLMLHFLICWITILLFLGIKKYYSNFYYLLGCCSIHFVLLILNIRHTFNLFSINENYQQLIFCMIWTVGCIFGIYVQFVLTKHLYTKRINKKEFN